MFCVVSSSGIFWLCLRKSYERYRRGGDLSSYFCVSMCPMIKSWLSEVRDDMTVSSHLLKLCCLVLFWFCFGSALVSVSAVSGGVV